MELARFYALVARRIMLPMTPAQTRANGLGNPSLPQLWLTAMLRMLVELVRNVVSTFQMRSFPLKRDWHTRDDEAPLPRVTSDTIKEPIAVVQDSPIALMLSSMRSVRPSKHEGVLTPVSHTSPSPSVSHATRAIHLRLLRMGRQAHHRDEGELPPSVRSTGGGGLRALARKTEGVRRGPRSGRIGPVDQFEQRTPERKRGRESHIRTPN